MEYTEDEMLLAAIENTFSDLIDIFVKLNARDLVGDGEDMILAKAMDFLYSAHDDVDGLVKSNEGKVVSQFEFHRG